MHFTPLPSHTHSHCSVAHTGEELSEGQGGEEDHVEFASVQVAEAICRVREEVKVAGPVFSMREMTPSRYTPFQARHHAAASRPLHPAALHARVPQHSPHTLSKRV